MKGTLETLALLLVVGIGSMAIPELAYALPNNTTLKNLSANRGQLIRHTIKVPRNADILSIRMSGGLGDADLYVRKGAAPTLSRFDCRPRRTGNQETCLIRKPEANTYHIMIRAYRPYTGVILKVRFARNTNTAPVAGNLCMNTVEKQLLNAHNAKRTQGRRCGGQFYPAVPPLEWSCRLDRVADAHSRDMANTNFFSHTGSDGSDPGQRMTAGGYAWRAYGENIAAGQPTVDSVMQGWMSSPGHCRNIMSSAVTEMGAAKISSPGADYSGYWTVVFGRPR